MLKIRRCFINKVVEDWQSPWMDYTLFGTLTRFLLQIGKNIPDGV
jgi:hypothetical protein